MECLVTELLFEVLSYLSVVDLASVALVNRKCHAAAMASLFPGAVLQDEALHTSPDHWNVCLPIDKKVPLPYIL